MTKAINVGIWIVGLVFAFMGIQAAFFPREGHEASMKSLAGTVIGALLIGSYFLWLKSPRAGRITSAVLCLACLLNFVPKFIKDTSNMYPAGISVILSGLLFLMLGAGHMMAQKSKTTEA